LANKGLVSTDGQLAKGADKVVVQIFWETNALEIQREISRVSTAGAQRVEESTLRSTQQVVSSKTKSEEVERVGAVGLGSYVD